MADASDLAWAETSGKARVRCGDPTADKCGGPWSETAARDARKLAHKKIESRSLASCSPRSLTSRRPSPGNARGIRRASPLTAFTHFGLSGLAMSDSLSWLDGGSGDGAFAGAVWRPPPGKRGAFLHARLVETGGRGVRVRRLGASRAGEIRLTRFLRNAAVTVEEMAAEAA